MFIVPVPLLPTHVVMPVTVEPAPSTLIVPLLPAHLAEQGAAFSKARRAVQADSAAVGDVHRSGAGLSRRKKSRC